MRVTWVTFAPITRGPGGQLTSRLASARYRVLAPMRGLGEERYRHKIVAIGPQTADPPWDEALDADVLIFSKSDAWSNEELAGRARQRGLPIIFDVCDNYYEDPRVGPHFRRMSELADAIVCPTAEMAAAAQPYGRCAPIVIEDPYEAPRGAPAYAPGETLKLLWFGFPMNLPSLDASLDELAAYSKQRALSLVVLTKLDPKLEAGCREVGERTGGRLTMTPKPWSLEALWRELADCDAVLIPAIETSVTRVKSPNRMVEALWSGRPVVAQPLPAYRTFADWTPVGPSLAEGLAWLDARRAEVPRLIAQAQAFIERRHSPAAVARRWEEVIRPVTGQVRT